MKLTLQRNTDGQKNNAHSNDSFTKNSNKEHLVDLVLEATHKQGQSSSSHQGQSSSSHQGQSSSSHQAEYSTMYINLDSLKEENQVNEAR